MGADGRLATADDIEKYFEAVASQSDRVKIVDIGTTTEGHRTIAAIISAPDNIKNLESIRAANQRLSDPRTLPADEAAQIVARHKVVLAIGGGIHASEVGATQSANELLYWLATASDTVTLDILQNVIVILIPSLNPDGHRLVVDWYSKDEGHAVRGRPDAVALSQYAGHDLNRDAFMMNMPESRNLSRFFYTEWHPQVFLTHAPDGEQRAALVRAAERRPDRSQLRPDDLARGRCCSASAMTLELERDHHTRRRVQRDVRLLLARLRGLRAARPQHGLPADRSGERQSRDPDHCLGARPARRRSKELPDYNPRINFPDPWPGGPWRLRDIVDYDLSAVHGLLRAVALYREPIVLNFYDMGARAIESG